MFNLDKIFRLKNDIASRDAMIKSLRADLDRLTEAKNKEIVKDVQSSTFVLDWENMDAFSIERMGEKKVAYTVIGYYKTVGTDRIVDEWKFYCSHEQHEKLAKEFNDYIQNRKD